MGERLIRIDEKSSIFTIKYTMGETFLTLDSTETQQSPGWNQDLITLINCFFCWSQTMWKNWLWLLIKKKKTGAELKLQSTLLSNLGFYAIYGLDFYNHSVYLKSIYVKAWLLLPLTGGGRHEPIAVSQQSQSTNHPLKPETCKQMQIFLATPTFTAFILIDSSFKLFCNYVLFRVFSQ